VCYIPDLTLIDRMPGLPYVVWKHLPPDYMSVVFGFVVVDGGVVICS
jgi:hypothetical protein